MTDPPPAGSLSRVAWGTLGVTVLVSVWGAFVRATGSGAGCGSHWPLCDGAVVPRGESVEMLIEYSHRVTSGLALLAVVSLWILVVRAPWTSRFARRAALASMIFIGIEAAIGAALVLLELVADNASAARAFVMGGHLINTFALVGALTLTAWDLRASSHQRTPARALTWGPAGWAFLACTVAFFLTNVAGAVAALGDTLFPVISLSEAFDQELSAAASLLVRLRVLHPALAVATALGILATIRKYGATPDHRSVPLSRTLVTLLAVQIVAGGVNVLLLAPVWLQLLHLFLANGVWIAFVLLGASRLRPAALA